MFATNNIISHCYWLSGKNGCLKEGRNTTCPCVRLVKKNINTYILIQIIIYTNIYGLICKHLYKLRYICYKF